MATQSVTPPISLTRLKQIANDACELALSEVEHYEHSKTENWNNIIINNILRSLISESSVAGNPPSYKYTVNSTLIQHLVPSSPFRPTKPRQGEEGHDSANTETTTNNEEIGKDGKIQIGRRGMHSAIGAFWNEKSDGMWSYKYEGGDNKGLDVVISIVWMAI